MKRLWAVLGLVLALGFVLGVSQEGPGQGNNAKDIHDPANAVANLEVHKDLQATLFASEPMITNPTNLDIDHRGRVWICDVQNYRGHSGKRPEGDRILILEDTNGDGQADKATTFYQGRDIAAALGICVLGNKVIVSCSPNVFVFTFDPKTDKVLKKEVLFTKTGEPQNDHSAHSFVFGPDGRLYWNFGNAGHAVHDKDGKPVVDLAGNVVSNRAQPYRQGMAFRCDLDGSNFEVLAHNFRNNYELAVDSFGTVWQSDNDDDGNRGVRLNFLLEFGNYGYVDEMTGAGWKTKRTNMETDISLQHWHQNDPGVVPNLLGTGNGSPAGICVYEGTLLPKVFHGQIIHCDAGPNVVRCYPVVADGAGYKVTEIVNILDGSKKNNWFRPADVCVAPDGSLFVTDWYDPGVGGNAQGDLDRGRIFRVAPLGNKPSVPKFNFDTSEGNIDALKNPNLATRALAWLNLNKLQAAAEPALLKMFQGAEPIYRARALWLLGQIEGRGRHYVDLALADADPNIRIVGIRLARQLGLDIVKVIDPVINKEPHPAVHREFAIALRFSQGTRASELWTTLAHWGDPKDRWLLEALGIGADLHWDERLDVFLRSGPRPSKELWRAKAYRDVVWRSRGLKTPELLIQCLGVADPEELPRLLRAFDFQKDTPAKNAALFQLAFGDQLDPVRQGFVTTEALLRIKNLDLKSNSLHAAAFHHKVLDRVKGTSSFVELVGKFNVSERYPELLALAQKTPDQQLGVDAMRALLERDQGALIRTGLENKELAAALSTVQALANAAHERGVPLLWAVAKDGKQDLELRRQATRALAKTRSGALLLLKLERGQKLAKELTQAAGSALSLATWKDVKQQAAELFPLPAAKDKAAVPPIPELVKRQGNAARGQELFAKAGTCATCHVVNGAGKEVGPNLSEIGKKLGREALFESILFPSASISHNYETYVIETKRGDVVNGLLLSQTREEVAIKGADALVRTFKKADVDSISRSGVSIMPADLHKQLTVQDLADVVEYLLTLREAGKK